MRVLIASGGTGGHVYPAVALVQCLKKKIPASSILWVGGERELEKKIILEQKIRFKPVRFFALPRSFSVKWLRFLLSIFISFFQSVLYMLSFKPDVVVGMGSFHSCPVVMTAFFFRIPTLICEQNVYLSLSNRILLPFSSKIALSFSHSLDYLPSTQRRKAMVSGNPVREEIRLSSKQEGMSELGLEEGKLTLLFLGGSQGAQYLNEVAVEVLLLLQKTWKENIQFILITGKKNYHRVTEKLKQIKIKGKIFSYLASIHQAFAAADLIISRSGATTISEITARGIPAILVPYPFATNKHQLKNALFLEEKRAAKVIIQNQLTASLLKNEIEKILGNYELREKMRKTSKSLGHTKAANTLTDLIIDMGTD